MEQRTASDWAAIVRDRLQQTHRGAVYCERDDTTIAFGNDAYGKMADGGEAGRSRFYRVAAPNGNVITRAIVGILRSAIARRGLLELDFNTCLTGYSWALLVKGNHAGDVFDDVWRAYELAGGGRHEVQRAIALSACRDFDPG